MQKITWKSANGLVQNQKCGLVVAVQELHVQNIVNSLF